jgi:ketosteroid isomerase-like protein
MRHGQPCRWALGEHGDAASPRQPSGVAGILHEEVLISEQNVEVVRSVIDAWNRRDIERLMALAAPQIEYVNAPDAVEPGTRRGRDGVAAVAQSQWESLPGGRQELDRLHDRGDEIISAGRISRLMPGSDARIENPVLLSWTIKNGRVTRIEMLGAGTRFQEALKAAGLSE